MSPFAPGLWRTWPPTGNDDFFTYRADGQYATTSSHNVQTTYSYDPTTVLLQSTVDTVGRTTSMGYDGNGNETSFSDGTTSTASAYDDANRVISTLDALGNETTNEYGDGEHVTFTHTPDAPSGVGTTTTYDDAGRPASITSPDGALTTFGYTPGQGLTSVIDPLNRTTCGGYFSGPSQDR